MIRSLFVSALFLTATMSSIAGPTSSKPALRACFAQIIHIPDPTTHRQKVEECLRLAEPGQNSPDITLRALYLESLSMYLEPSTWPDTYLSISNQLSSYYRSSIENDLTPESLRSLDNDTLADLLEGISSGMFYNAFVSTVPVGLDREIWIFTEMERRGIANIEQARVLYRNILKEGEWPLAKELTTRWPNLGRLPKILTHTPYPKTNPAYLALSRDQKSFDLKFLNLDSGAKIVFLGSCHFAVEAIKTLSEHIDFRETMKRIGLVVGAPQDLADDNGLAEIVKLRTLYPEFEFQTMHKTAVWAQNGFNVAYSPNITFLRDGSVRYTLKGAGPKLVERFCEGLKAIAITDSPSCNSPIESYFVDATSS